MVMGSPSSSFGLPIKAWSLSALNPEKGTRLTMQRA